MRWRWKTQRSETSFGQTEDVGQLYSLEGPEDKPENDCRTLES